MQARLFKALIFSVFIMAFSFITGCSMSDVDTQSNKNPAELKHTNELVVYSARKEQYVKPFVDKFQAQTGIKVNLLVGDETLVNKVLIEKNKPQADIFFSTDVGSIEFLHSQGALQSYAAPGAQDIPAQYKPADNSWYPLGARARVLMYNKDKISAEAMPKTFWELTDPKWKGQFMIPRGSNGSTVAHITALRTVWGDEKTRQWIKAVAENSGAIVKDHAEIRKAVGAGEYKIGVVNDNYFYQQLMEENVNNVGIIYPDQGPNELGVFVNVSGFGIIQNAPNLKNAQAFVDFMLKPEQLKFYAVTGSELPVNTAVTPPEFKGILKLNEFKAMQVPIDKIGPSWIEAKKLIEEAGMDMNEK